MRLADADCVGSATLVAVTVTCVLLLTLEGALYSPPEEMLPG